MAIQEQLLSTRSSFVEAPEHFRGEVREEGGTKQTVEH